MSKVVSLKKVGLPDYYHRGSLTLKTMKDFPFVKNSQGEPVTAVNMYLTSYFNTNKSPNTIKRTAHCLNIFIKYCEDRKISLQNLLILVLFRQHFPKSNKFKEQNWVFKIFNFFVYFLGYSCALVGDILLQGHLYVTENYIAFHSNVFGYITRVIKLHCFSF